MGNIYMSYAKRLTRMVCGLFICGLSVVLSIQAQLGLSPWNVFHMGISLLTDVTIGRVSIMVGFVIVIVDAVMKEKIGFGTVINMFLIGTFTDLIMNWNIIPVPGSLVGRVCMMLVSIILNAYGIYLYISNGLGGGPRDSFMLVLLHRTKLKVYSARILMEGTVLIIGWLMGGTVGIGTIIAVLGTGPTLDMMFRLFKFDVGAVKHESIKDTLSKLKEG